MLADASRVPEWGYGEAYRDPGRGEGWLAVEIGRVRAARAVEVAAHTAALLRRQDRDEEHGGVEVGR